MVVNFLEEGWGAKVIDRLSSDLTKEFPDMKGFSPRNLKYMRSFAAAWTDPSIVQAPLAQLSWYHNIALLDKALLLLAGRFIWSLAQWETQITRSLPKELQSSLPTIEEIEAELGEDVDRRKEKMTV